MAVVVAGGVGCAWWLVEVADVVGGGGGDGERTMVQIVSVDGSSIRWWWLWVEAVMVADSGGSGVWWLRW